MFFKGKLMEVHNRENSFIELNENIKYGQQLAKIGSWTYDIQSDVVLWTEGVYHILGCNSQGLSNHLDDFLRYVFDDDLEKVKEFIHNVLMAKEYDIEFRIITQNKQIKCVHEKTKVVYDENNKPIKVFGIIQDITEHKFRENNLKTLGENLNMAQRVAGVGSWKYDIINDEFFGSDEMFRIYGVDQSKFDNDLKNTIKLIHQEDQLKVQEAMEKHLAGQSCTFEYRIPQHDGTNKYVIGKGEPIIGNEGQVVGVLGTLQDITEKKILEQEIELKQEQIKKIQRKFNALIKESFDVLEILDPDGTIVYISEASEKVIGYKPEERIGKKIYDYYEETEIQKLKEMINNIIHDPKKIEQRDIAFKSKDGKVIYLDVKMQSFLHDSAIKGIVVNFRDVTNRVEMEKKITYISVHDQLTGLPNNIYLRNKLKLQFQHAKESNSSFALFMLDFNDYKYIENTLGYIKGEQFIIQISKRLERYCGITIFLCRYSEDRFVILIEGINTIEEYENIANEIIELFSEPIIVGKYELYVVVTIGIRRYREDVKDSEQFIRQAEDALFISKNEEKNSYKFYSSDINIQAHKQFELRNDLKKAIDSNHLMIYYQPMVNLKTNEIIAAEALIRWEHLDWGIVSPKEFISMAEEMGYISKMGSWVLREVCKNYKRWLNNGLPHIKVTVNFSSIQFFESKFVENIKNIIDEYELNPNFLIIEITESILMVNTDKVNFDIKRLQSFGIQVALDDFGTGYSSLAYLSSFNIDILKLDGSFIRNIDNDETSIIITRNVIKMAQELNIKLVAEGIENWEQLNLLKELKCFTGQGYIYSKPIPLDDFETILNKRICNPILPYGEKILREEKREYFRVKFSNSLEVGLTIMEIKGRKVNVGNTKVLVKDIGPGGLCFISNIDLPVKRDVIFQFITELIGEEIKVYGCTVWKEELDYNLFEYGVEFTINENERSYLVKILNQVQIKMKNNILFADGKFISSSPNLYFKS